jgi:hypothetical protein|tara:strand:- start:1059 stop:1265 length:207 start_codon:yes stop_codon:yes gene_type:complete
MKKKKNEEVPKEDIQEVMDQLFMTLMFYADTKNYMVIGDMSDTVINNDKGARARDILQVADSKFAQLK